MIKVFGIFQIKKSSNGEMKTTSFTSELSPSNGLQTINQNSLKPDVHQKVHLLSCQALVLIP